MENFAERLIIRQKIFRSFGLLNQTQKFSLNDRFDYALFKQIQIGATSKLSAS